jgi:hypothetical protein
MAVALGQRGSASDRVTARSGRATQDGCRASGEHEGAVGASAARARRAIGTRGFKPLRQYGVRRPRGNGALPHGPGAAASDRWGPLVNDFQIKIHPERN